MPYQPLWSMRQREILAVADSIVRSHPGAWDAIKVAHQTSREFINLVALACQQRLGDVVTESSVVGRIQLRARDIGVNIKRGHQGQSIDVMAFPNDSGVRDATGKFSRLELIDIVAGAEGPTPSLTWGDVTQATLDQHVDGGWAQPVGDLTGDGGSPPSTWAEAEVALYARFRARFPIETLGGDVARAWVQRLAEQFAFTFPDRGWGTKVAGPGRPLSTDVLAQQTDTLIGFRVLPTLERQALDLTGQQFVSVRAVDHVGGASVPVNPPGGGGAIPPSGAGVPRDVWALELAEVNTFYAAADGLRRTGGMVTGVDERAFQLLHDYAHGTAIDHQQLRWAAAEIGQLRADMQALAQWGYDLLLRRPVDDIKAAIRSSEEWAGKHPGARP